MYDHTLHHGKNFCCYCLQAFSTKEILRCHVKHCFKTSGKKSIKMFQKGEYVRLKNYGRKLKSPQILKTF